jgi:hypothetical protein
VDKFLLEQSRRESLILYAFGTMLVLLLLIVVILVAPAV